MADPVEPKKESTSPMMSAAAVPSADAADAAPPSTATPTTAAPPAGADDDMLDDDDEPGKRGAEGADADADNATDATQQPALGLDGANDEAPAAPAAPAGEMEARIAQKKDATLREFIGKMDDYAPIIPDSVVHHYLTLAGLPPPPATPPALARLLALATQKFIADVAADAYQYARIRTSHTTSNTAAAMMGANLGLPGQVPGAAGATPAPGASKDDKGGKGALGLGTQRPGFGGGGGGGAQGRTVLTMEDLGMAVGEYGVNVRRGEFYR